MRLRDTLDETVQAEPPQIVGYPASGDRFGCMARKRDEVVTQVVMSETARTETEQD